MDEAVAAGTDQVRELVAALGSLAPAVDDADRIERVRLLEELKSVAAAAQAIETRDFAASQRTAQAVAGVPTKQQGRGVAAQIALARRISPWAARRYVGWANVLTAELPETFAALKAGRITEWRATLIARETIWLSREHREEVDAELAPHLQGWGDRRVEAEAKKAGYRLDPHGFLERVRGADTERRVTMRPAPDAMARLTALVPVAQCAAAYGALCAAADTTTARGDDRGRGQIMADTLIQRLTGQQTAAAVPVEIELLITDRTLLGHDSEPAQLAGCGPVPADIARNLALADSQAPRWLRRVFRHPVTGQLAAMDTTRRLFTDNQRLFVRLRDHTCRTPWCDAPIRHTDHLLPAQAAGPTSTSNAAGTCEACNHTKQAPGWTTLPDTDGTITTTTPTGHQYASRPPVPPGRGHTREPLDIDVSVIDLIYLHGRRAA